MRRIPGLWGLTSRAAAALNSKNFDEAASLYTQSMELWQRQFPDLGLASKEDLANLYQICYYRGLSMFKLRQYPMVRACRNVSPSCALSLCP